MIRITVWNEFAHEQTEEKIKAVYPNGIHACLAEFLSKEEDFEVRTATLYNDKMELNEDAGLSQELIDNTDVLFWWGHMKHKYVPDEVAVRVQQAVLNGMGLIVLHSGHHSKPFRLLMGTNCNLTWHEDGEQEKLWVLNPAHPICRGLGRYIKLDHEETYGEPFTIPEPDHLILIGAYEGGEVFRAGCCYRRSNGKIFYFQPGHESFPTFKNPDVQKVLVNAVRWAKPEVRIGIECPHVAPETW